MHNVYMVSMMFVVEREKRRKETILHTIDRNNIQFFFVEQANKKKQKKSRYIELVSNRCIVPSNWLGHDA